jgi:hypothetical protein
VPLNLRMDSPLLAWRLQPSAVERPTGAVLTSQQFVGFGAIRHAAGGAVVVELLADAAGDQTPMLSTENVAVQLPRRFPGLG